MVSMCEIAAQRGWPIYLYGGAPNVLEALERILPERYSGLQIAGSFSPPFRPLSDEEEAEHSQMINASGAKLCLWPLAAPNKNAGWRAMFIVSSQSCLALALPFPWRLAFTPRALNFW